VTAPATTIIAPDTVLDPLQGEARTIEDWVTTFHLSLVVLDPFTQQSALIIPTAARVLQNFSGSNCRMAWLVAGTPEQTRQFLGSWADEILTFSDSQRDAIKSLGVAELPAFLHINQGLEVVNLAQGWNPVDWRKVSSDLAKQMQWSNPDIPLPKDPPAFHGTSAIR